MAVLMEGAPDAPLDPWCHPAITASHAFAMLELMVG
jgi:hypothetical protein